MNRRALFSLPAAALAATVVAQLPQQARALGFATVVDVTDYGVVGDGVTDNLAAYQALDAGCVNGVTLYHPPGSYLVGAPFVPAHRLNFVGAGRQSSVIKTSHPTADLLTIGQMGTRIEDIGLGSTVQKTGGALVRCNVPLLTMRDVLVDGYWQGIVLNGATLSYLENVFGGLLQPPTPGRIAPGSAYLVIGPNTSAGIQLKAVSANSGSALIDQPTYGVWLGACMDLTIEGCQIMQHGINLAIGPGSGQVVASLNAVNCYWDTGQRGMLICPTGSGAVVRAGFVQNWFGNNASDGIYVLAPTGTTVSGVRIDGATASFNGGRGMVWAGPVDYYWALNNDLRSNALGGLLDAGTGIHKSMAGNLT